MLARPVPCMWKTWYYTDFSIYNCCYSANLLKSSSKKISRIKRHLKYHKMTVMMVRLTLPNALLKLSKITSVCFLSSRLYSKIYIELRMTCHFELKPCCSLHKILCFWRWCGINNVFHNLTTYASKGMPILKTGSYDIRCFQSSGSCPWSRETYITIHDIKDLMLL